MSNDVSRVYQFLANLGDWKTKADKNSDGTIVKSEFSSFMEENYEVYAEIATADNAAQEANEIEEEEDEDKA